MKKLYGLIGFPLSHSFSGKYFDDKFKREGITDCEYRLFEIESIEKVRELFDREELRGFNVTIPYKHEIIPFLDELDHSAEKVGAVNVVKIFSDGRRKGYNSDYYGFRTSLENWLPSEREWQALVLGTGGAARAVWAVLDDLSIPFLKVSRHKAKGDITYEDLIKNHEIFKAYSLIINTTPLGMSPHTESRPQLPYDQLNADCYLFDLIYNPSITVFMTEGSKRGAKVKNGLEMLELQAEKSWEIWNA